jgi:hypothetical protein
VISGGRQCPAPDCSASIPHHIFACRRHWFALPAVVRRHINNAWADFMDGELELNELEAAQAEAFPHWAAS